MSKRASDEVLDNLHRMVAEELLRRITTGEASPAELNAAIKFLQNNGIEATMTPGSNLDKLANALPSFNDDDEVYLQ